MTLITTPNWLTDNDSKRTLFSLSRRLTCIRNLKRKQKRWESLCFNSRYFCTLNRSKWLWAERYCSIRAPQRTLQQAQHGTLDFFFHIQVNHSSTAFNFMYASTYTIFSGTAKSLAFFPSAPYSRKAFARFHSNSWPKRWSPYGNSIVISAVIHLPILFLP